MILAGCEETTETRSLRWEFVIDLLKQSFNTN
jgi:hypothetical protein